MIGDHNPGHIGSTNRIEHLVHMPPGRDELTSSIAIHALGPCEPVTVHLVIEPQEEWVSPVARARSPATDIPIERTIDDAPQRECRLILRAVIVPRAPIDERNRTMLTHRLERLGVERLRHAVRVPRLTEMNDRNALPRLPLKRRNRPHIPRRITMPRHRAGNPRTPIDPGCGRFAEPPDDITRSENACDSEHGEREEPTSSPSPTRPHARRDALWDARGSRASFGRNVRLHACMNSSRPRRA